MLRYENGVVKLAPLFDFAPMYLDPEGIARVCRWQDGAETAGDPEWGKVVEIFPGRRDFLRASLRDLGHLLQDLPDIMRDCGVDDDIIEQRSRSVQAHSQQLLAL